MMEFGETLRKAREAKGLTISELAAATRLAPSAVENLESESFESIAAPIYGRGFVKLYCEEVGLDPKPMIDEFMAIYNGDREPVIRERIHQEPPEAANPFNAAETPTTQAAPVADQPKSAPCDELFSMPPPPAAQPPMPLPDPQPTPPPQVSVRPLSQLGCARRRTIPHIPWRLAVLVVAAAAMAVALAYGIRTLYRATSNAPTAAAKPATVEPPAAERQVKPKADATQKPSPAKVGPSVKRTPQAIPSLYID